MSTTESMQPEYGVVAVNRFTEHLRAALSSVMDTLRTTTSPITEWHVVFRFGTVVSVKPSIDPVFAGYPEDKDVYRVSFPVHRVPHNDCAPYLKYNSDVWRHQCNTTSGDVNGALRCGYARLLGDGYPFPGFNSCRISLPIRYPPSDEPLAWLILWPDRDMRIMNLVQGDRSDTAMEMGCNTRQLDFITPRVTAVISPELELTWVK